MTLPISAIAITAMSALLPIPAVAQNALGVPATPTSNRGAPVIINSCGAMLSDNPSTTIGGIALTSSSGGIRIQFTNESTKPIDLVNFGVQSNGDSFVIRDVGTFSPGITIDHKYRNGAGQSFVLPAFIAPKIACAVDSVRFTDGTVWRRGEPALFTAALPVPEKPKNAAQPPPLSATPASLRIEEDGGNALFMISSSERLAGFKETDTCTGIASVYVVATGESAASYSVKPIARGSCSATVIDESGHSIAIPISVQ